MTDEFQNNSIPEVTSANEYNAVQESQTMLESVEQREEQVVQETVDSPKVSFNKEKKSNALSMLTGSLVTIVASVVVGMTGLINVGMSAEFDTVDYNDGAIKYSVSVENMTNEETLTAYLYDGQRLVDTISLVDEDNDGVIEGQIGVDADSIQQRLADGESKIEYRLNLKGVVGLNVERSFDSYVVKIEKVASHFEDVDCWCNCGVDGCYYFQMNFTDDFGIFTDMSAYIEDSQGNKSYCTFTDNWHEQQKINVMSLKGANGKLYISYKADGEEKTIEQDISF